MQVRETAAHPHTALEELLMRSDDDALEYLADCLTFEREVEPARAPLPSTKRSELVIETEG
jgi:hypothetical protein